MGKAKAGRSASPARKVKKNEKVEEFNHPSAATKEDVHYEFGGPVGALSIILGLPLVIFLLYFTCHKSADGRDICVSTWDPLSFPYMEMLKSVPTSLAGWFPREAVLLYTSWMVLQLVLERLLPGEAAEGVPIEDDQGKRLTYTLSGHLQFWVSLLLMGHSLPQWSQSTEGVWSISGLGRVPLELIYDYYLQIAAVSVVGATVLSVYL